MAQNGNGHLSPGSNNALTGASHPMNHDRSKNFIAALPAGETTNGDTSSNEKQGPMKTFDELKIFFHECQVESGYPFEPTRTTRRVLIPGTKKWKMVECVETQVQYDQRLAENEKLLDTLCHLKLAYEEIVDWILKSKGFDKRRWQIVEGLLDDESRKLQAKLKISGRKPLKETTI